MTEPGMVGEQIDQNGQVAPPADMTARSVAEHLSTLLLTADNAAKRIVEEAETRARIQLGELELRIREMEAEATRLSSWREQTDQMIQGLATAIAEFRADMEKVPQRITEALTPLAAHVPLVVRQIDQLAVALKPPQGGHQVVQPVQAVHPVEQPVQAVPAPVSFPGAEPAVEEVHGEVTPGWTTDWSDITDGEA
jgi:septal ring factor EnvC (AmiA/AmiB activator)